MLNNLVIIESPFKSPDPQTNFLYAKLCLKDSLNRGESPFASHLLYTQVLNDNDDIQRAKGMWAGWEWYAVADLCAVYTDLGLSEGMKMGIEAAEIMGVPIEMRSIK